MFQRLKPVENRLVRPVDMNALRALVDRDDEAFLRRNLPPAEFFRLKRLRIRVLWKYVRRIADNSEIVMQACVISRQDPDVNAAKVATDVTTLAWKINVQCLVAFAKLTVEYMFPAIQLRGRLLRPVKR